MTQSANTQFPSNPPPLADFADDVLNLLVESPEWGDALSAKYMDTMLKYGVARQDRDSGRLVMVPGKCTVAKSAPLTVFGREVVQLLTTDDSKVDGVTHKRIAELAVIHGLANRNGEGALQRSPIAKSEVSEYAALHGHVAASCVTVIMGAGLSPELAGKLTEELMKILIAALLAKGAAADPLKPTKVELVSSVVHEEGEPLALTDSGAVARLWATIPDDPYAIDVSAQSPEYRSAIAKLALNTAYDGSRSKTDGVLVAPELSIGDMLSDLRHLCDKLGVAFAKLDKQGRENYWRDLGIGVFGDLHEAARLGCLDVIRADRINVESLALTDEQDKTVWEVAKENGHLDQLPPELRAPPRLQHPDGPVMQFTSVEHVLTALRTVEGPVSIGQGIITLASGQQIDLNAGALAPQMPQQQTIQAPQISPQSPFARKAR